MATQFGNGIFRRRIVFDSDPLPFGLLVNPVDAKLCKNAANVCEADGMIQETYVW